MNKAGTVTRQQESEIFNRLNRVGKEEKKTEKDEKKQDGRRDSVFAGNLNLMDDPIVQKRKEAQKKAMDVVRDAWDIDRTIDQNIEERKEHYRQMKALSSDAKDEIARVNQQKDALREQHMVEPDSKEQKDLELLEKRQAYMSGDRSTALTAKEWEECARIEEEGLTDYQKGALELNQRAIHFKHEAEDAEKKMKDDMADVRTIRLERLKKDPMVEAEKNADEIMENASKEIIAMLKEDMKENIDEKKEEADKKAEETKEEEKEQEQQIEEIKLEHAKQEAMMLGTEEAAEKVKAQQRRMESMDLEMDDMTDIADSYRHSSDVVQSLAEIRSSMKLLDADLKGISVDEEG